MFEARWYDCDIRESEADAPDFDKVPEHKRKQVEARWRERLMCKPPSRFQLWGPQIPLYLRDPTMQVEIISIPAE